MRKGNDDIEKLIIDNLDGLNDAEPKEGHFARFEAKLNRQSRKGKVNLRLIWRIAAAAVFLFLVVNQALIYFTPKETKEITSIGQISPEYREVEFYYTNSIKASLNQWQNLDNAGLLSANDKQMMENELKEFDAVHKNLQKELEANPYDDRVVNAMLEYYQDKLNIINMIVTKLKQVQTQKEASHEIKM